MSQPTREGRINLDDLQEQINEVVGYGPINDIDEGNTDTESPSAKNRKRKLENLKLKNSELIQNDANQVTYIATGGNSLIVSNNSIPDGEKLIIRIMGDLYKFSAKHAHLVASFIFAVGLYKVGTDITPLLLKFATFLNKIKPDGGTIATASKFAFYATTVFSSVLFWMGCDKDSIQKNLLDLLDERYEFKNHGVNNVIFNHTIGETIIKNITLATVVNDLYTGLACFSKVCTNTIPTLVFNATDRVWSIVSKAFIDLNNMKQDITNSIEIYLESNDYSEDDASTISTASSKKSEILTKLSSHSTQSILENDSIIEIVNKEVSNVEQINNINEIVDANDEIVDAIVQQDLTGIVISNNDENVSAITSASNSQDRDGFIGGKSRRKHKKITKKTHKKNKKTHKKHNKKSHKKQKRSRKH